MEYAGMKAHCALFVVLITVVASFFAVEPVHAQTFEIGNTIELTTSPADPLPNSTTVVSLSAYTLNTNGATIRWYVNGSERESDQNARSITLQTGNIGSPTTVRAVVTPQSGASVSVEKTLKPSQIDLIIESDSRVPSFYKGRALPVGDELVVATALPHIGGQSDASALTYTWKLGSTMLFGGPVKGKSQVAFTMPKSATTLALTVSDSSGNRIGSTNMKLTPATPELYFYEDNPLRSMSRQAIGDSFTLVGDEVSVRAEPYFVDPNIFNIDPVLTWTLDGKKINGFGNDPQTITLRGAGGSGQASVGFELINQQSLLQFLRDSFTIHFES